MLKINANWGRAGYVIFVSIWGMGQFTITDHNLRYISLMSIVAVLGLLLYCTKGARKVETGVIVQMSIIFVVFMFISCIAMFFNHFKFYAWRDFMQIYMPALLAFLIYNTEPSENMDFYFHAMLITQGLGYIISFLPTLSLANILSINIFESFSPFESVIASRFTVLFVYYYMRKRWALCLLCFFLNYLSLKRMNVLFAVIILLFGWLIRKIKYREIYLSISKLAFILSPLAIRFMCSEGFVTWFNNSFKITFSEFTSSRLDQFVYVLDYNGPLLGLGAVNQYVESHFWIDIFHSDLLRLSIETTMFGAAVFVICMFNMVRIRQNMLTLSTMIFMMLILFCSIMVGDFPAIFAIFLLCHTDIETVNAAEVRKKLAHSGARASIASAST